MVPTHVSISRADAHCGADGASSSFSIQMDLLRPGYVIVAAIFYHNNLRMHTREERRELEMHTSMAQVALNMMETSIYVYSDVPERILSQSGVLPTSLHFGHVSVRGVTDQMRLSRCSAL